MIPAHSVRIVSALGSFGQVVDEYLQLGPLCGD
jgi:hypothetical protein